MAYRVLVVEDEGIIAMMLSRMLERLGCTVLATIDNSDDAEVFFNREYPDLVFMDIQINGSKNGIELAKSLVRQQPGARVIFLSANTDQTTRNAALSVKPMAFLPKPVEVDDLANVLRAMDQAGTQHA